MGFNRGANIVRDGLVFGYDIGYPMVLAGFDSYRFNLGEPTTNLADTNTKRTIIGHSVGAYGHSLTTSDASSKGPGWKKINITTQGSNHRIAQFPYLTHLSGQTRTYIIEYDFGNLTFSTGSNTSGYYWKLDGNNGTMGDSTPVDNGYKKAITFTRSSDGSQAIFLCNNTTSRAALDETIHYRYYKVDVKNHSTPFTETDRSVSGSIIDITRAAEIDLTNISFNTNGQINFDGTNDYFTTSGLDIGTPSSVTFETVIKFDGTLDSNDRKVFHWDKTSTTNAVAQIRKGTNNGRLMYQHHDGTQWYTLIKDDAIVADKYTHITVTHSGTSAIMYKDGIQVATGTVGNLEYTNAGEILLGYRTNAEYWKGEIPIFKVYNRALTADEVLNNFNVVQTRFDI